MPGAAGHGADSVNTHTTGFYDGRPPRRGGSPNTAGSRLPWRAGGEVMAGERGRGNRVQGCRMNIVFWVNKASGRGPIATV